MANKSDVFIKLVLLFFISLLSFSVGTYVGKKYSDHQHKLAELEPSQREHSTAQHSEKVENNHEMDREPASEITDKEIAALAEEFIEDEKIEEH
nr:SPOR domain-containing protein [Pseudobdellovibrionaceae bacterium]